MSVRIWYVTPLSSIRPDIPPEADPPLADIKPIAIPATGRSIGTPASISAKVPAQTVAMDVEPLEARHSETMRIVYGNFSLVGSTARNAFSARAPCPVIRRLNPPTRPVSPTENGGKL